MLLSLFPRAPITAAGCSPSSSVRYEPAQFLLGSPERAEVLVMLLKRCPRGRQWGWKPTPGRSRVVGGASRQEGGGSVVGIPWEDTGSSPGPGRGGSSMPHGATKETQKC